MAEGLLGEMRFVKVVCGKIFVRRCFVSGGLWGEICDEVCGMRFVG